MAETLTATAHPTAASNSKERKKAIVEVCKQLQALDGRIEKLQADKRDVLHTKVKGFLDMKIGDFKAAYRLYQLEGDERKQLLDTLAECFEALGVGGQLDFLDAMDKADREAETPEKTSEEIENEGYHAAEKGEFADACPYESIRGKTAWISGFDRWQSEIAHSMAPSALINA